MAGGVVDDNVKEVNAFGVAFCSYFEILLLKDPDDIFLAMSTSGPPPLRNQGKAESTTLSKYVWQERNKGEEPEIIWSKLSSAKPYSLGGRSCPFCLAEKTAIATDTTGEMLNKLSNFSTSLSTGHLSSLMMSCLTYSLPQCNLMMFCLTYSLPQGNQKMSCLTYNLP